MIKIPGLIKSFASLVGGGARVGIYLPAIIEKDLLDLHKYQGLEGWFVYSPNDNIEIPEKPAQFKDTKSPSKLLHNVLYIEWKQIQDRKSGYDIPFNYYYEAEMRKIIDGRKENLI